MKADGSKRPVIVLCPHYAPDTAPTGVVMTRIVDELVRLGHRVHVVTSLPWYRRHRVEDGWTGRVWRKETTSWGSVVRVSPFAGRDKANVPRRALGFAAFSLLIGLRGLFVGGVHRRARAVVAMSPPLTLGLTGWVVAKVRRAPLVFNVQDVFPDAAISTGKLSNRRIIALAGWLERLSYRRSDAVVVLSDDLRDNVAAKMPAKHAGKAVVIPNFVDSDVIVPRSTDTAYRREFAPAADRVVMYAGNVGFSQSLDLLVDAARRMADVTFVVNGEGSSRADLEARAAGVANIVFVDYQPADRLAEVLASADVHVVPLRRGLGNVSVPSKAYSIMAAARPIVASIDADSEVARMIGAARCGAVVPPEDVDALVASLRSLLDAPAEREVMGARGRAWVVEHASPARVGESYALLIERLANR
ncbi:MAG: glycosyltransferase WbuB [Actinobacteria bacterium]|jgi:colanic acid biosynthesis glycosyl transferase WcaI|nr:glycosyltransferase WbuB [Actinomycetota bacterium]